MNIKSIKNTESQIKDWVKAFFNTGNTDYLGNIYEMFKKQILSHCWKMVNHIEDAQDLTSDTFIAAFKNLHTYDIHRPLFPWLRQIANNLCIDHIRRKKFMELKNLNNKANHHVHDPLSRSENQEVKREIQKTISLLKQPQRRCLCLFYIHEKSYKDIAKLTGYPYSKVRSYIQNARRNFRRLYRGDILEF